MVTKQKQKKTIVSDTVNMLLDPMMDLDDKKMLLAHLGRDDSLEASQTVEELLSMASNDIARPEYFKKRKKLDEMIQMLKDGPLRMGTYLGPAPSTNGQLTNRAHGLMENGDTAFPVILDS